MDIVRKVPFPKRNLDTTVMIVSDSGALSTVTSTLGHPYTAHASRLAWKTQLYISQKTNIGQGYISDLESGRRKGTTAALKKIASVLKVPLDLIA
jgi:hypothetical protein